MPSPWVIKYKNLRRRKFRAWKGCCSGGSVSSPLRGAPVSVPEQRLCCALPRYTAICRGEMFVLSLSRASGDSMPITQPLVIFSFSLFRNQLSLSLPPSPSSFSCSLLVSSFSISSFLLILNFYRGILKITEQTSGSVGERQLVSQMKCQCF